jgi:hypothetical protein
MKTNNVARKARIEASIQVVDTSGQCRQLAAGLCEIEHGAHTVLRRIEPGQPTEVRMSHEQFESLFASRQVVFLSW